MKTNHPIKKICEYCGKEFEANKRTVRYCSHTCNSKAYKETQRKQVVALTEALTSKKKTDKVKVGLAERDYLNISETATLLGWNKQTVYNYCHKEIIPAIRLSRRLTLIRRKDIDMLFDDIEPYEVLPTGERKPIEDWYTLDDITERYGILRHRIRKIISAENIPTKKDGTRTLVAKNKLDSYFKKKRFDKTLSNLAEWYTVPEITELYGMNTNAIHIFASRYAIPKKRVNGKLYYSKQHIDKLKE